MSTTRHLVNRQRRLATVAAAERTATPTATPTTVPEPAGPDTESRSESEPAGEPEADKEEKAEEAPRSAGPLRLRVSLPAVLCVLTVLLGSFAAWSFTSAGSLRDEPGRQNTALTDISRTSEVKGQITEAVGAVFSYNYAS